MLTKCWPRKPELCSPRLFASRALPLSRWRPLRLSARVLAAGPVHSVYSSLSRAGSRCSAQSVQTRGCVDYARALRPRTRGRRARESHGSRATLSPRPDRARPPGSPVHTDPAAESDPAQRPPHKRVSRRYLRRCWTRRSYRSLPGGTVEEGVRGKGGRHRTRRRPSLRSLPRSRTAPRRRSRLGRQLSRFLGDGRSGRPRASPGRSTRRQARHLTPL
jgi:hypothetical protein